MFSQLLFGTIKIGRNADTIKKRKVFFTHFNDSSFSLRMRLPVCLFQLFDGIMSIHLCGCKA